METVGAGPITVKTLEVSLAEVTLLYGHNYGESVDAELQYDSEGTPFVETVCTGPFTVKTL